MKDRQEETEEAINSLIAAFPTLTDVKRKYKQILLLDQSWHSELAEGRYEYENINANINNFEIK